jgi:hypothetical protein
MPPHRCCTTCTRESASPGGISLHRRSCSEYKTHMSTVWKLKNQATAALARGKFNATKGLGQTPGSQQHEAESSMQIDSDDIVVSLHVFTGSAKCSDYHLNSHIHLALSLMQPRLYCLHRRLLHRHLLHVLYWLCRRRRHFLHCHLLPIACPCCCYLGHHRLKPYHSQVVRCGSIVCQCGIRTSILNRHILYPRLRLPFLLYRSPHPLRQLSSRACSGSLYGIDSKQA